MLAMTPTSVVARLTKSAEAISVGAMRLSRFASNYKRRKARNDRKGKVARNDNIIAPPLIRAEVRGKAQCSVFLV